MSQQATPTTVFTIGHSTHTLEEFVEILRSHQIDLVADVRTVPRSRRNPQFNRETLPNALKAAGIRYVHLSALGGLRRPAANSPNGGWRNDSFRGFADYMQTAEFSKAVDGLLEMTRAHRVAVMCAEAVPWRCHRLLIGDALLVRGARVEDIMGVARAQPHALTAWAHVDGTRITYPAPAPDDVGGGGSEPDG
jgi:uncharacterized protein (DUF488 family)